MVKTICSIVEAVACVGCLVMATVTMVRKNRPEIPCDTCDNLLKKNKHNANEYTCGERGSFNYPPQYCHWYRERKDGGQETPKEETT